MLAGINMAVFEFTAQEGGGVGHADSRAAPVALPAHFAPDLDERDRLRPLIGFTKGYDFSVPEDIDFDFLKSCADCVGRLHLTNI